MILLVSSKCVVRELEENQLDQELIREIASGELAAFKLLHGHFWTLALVGGRMMWCAINGVGKPQKVDKS